MFTAKISFKFEGGIADERHLIDASEGVTFETAARQLLATQSYFFLHGQTPNGGAINHTADYRVYQSGRFQGSVVYDYLVEFSKIVADEATKHCAELFVSFLSATLASVLTRKHLAPAPLWNETAPVLAATDKNREPILDIEATQLHRWLQLTERETALLVDVMRPIGRSASKVTIFCNQTVVAQMTIADLMRLDDIHYQDQQRRRIRERQIEDALSSLRPH